jgi:hypothetical protein
MPGSGLAPAAPPPVVMYVQPAYVLNPPRSQLGLWHVSMLGKQIFVTVLFFNFVI